MIRLDGDGRVRAAYPFSAVPTAHAVTIEGGPSVYAMCAIDALGMADMLGRNMVIASLDPRSGDAIRVTVENGHVSWRPDSAVVFVGADLPSGQDCCSSEGRAAADRPP